jgi:hypothetical protein
VTVVLPVAAAMAATALLAGCGGATDDLPREAVSGTVTFDDQPLKAGMIQFQPAEPGASTAGGAAITDGRYSIAKSEGLVPGKYQVTISSTPPGAPPPSGQPGDPVAPPKETIPPKYNVKTTLSATVTKEGPNTFDFPLKSK